MKFNYKFILCSLLIIIISFYDIVYIGTRGGYKLSQNIKQIIHFADLTAISILGALFYLLFSEKWIVYLWIISYLFVYFIIILLALSTLFQLHLSNNIVNTSLFIRNIFISPLPFFALSILKQLGNQKKTN